MGVAWQDGGLADGWWGKVEVQQGGRPYEIAGVMGGGVAHRTDLRVRVREEENERLSERDA